MRTPLGSQIRSFYLVSLLFYPELYPLSDIYSLGLYAVSVVSASKSIGLLKVLLSVYLVLYDAEWAYLRGVRGWLRLPPLERPGPSAVPVSPGRGWCIAGGVRATRAA